MAPLELKSLQFRREREKTWTELETLVNHSERGLRSLSANQLARLPVVYRATLSGLSVARAISLDRNLVEYLESLCGRAYMLVYGAKRGIGATVFGFASATFPRTVRRFRWHLALSAAFMLLGTVAGFALTLADQERYYSFVPEGLAEGRNPASTTEELRATLYHQDEEPAAWLTAFATYLFTHNSRVGILSFALGFVAGIPVFFLMFYNGLILGAFAALFHSRGLSLDLWGWLLPHGITELTAIALCGGAGLILAQSLVFPGQYRRLTSLAIQGRQAARIVLGAILMLLVAGLIEGVFRQTVLSVPIRYALAAISLVFWVVYFRTVGRERE